MSLGLESEVEKEILQALDTLGKGSAVEVAYWRMDEGMDVFSACEIGITMMAMEAKGLLTFKDGKYRVALEQSAKLEEAV
jgi:hypothetical protein